ncbi:suppressor of fused domain protein [Streptoalloteichus tenebrarius]|uniref:suppressor of fused domain protein n=1 Tax=Streptoalloteichus tenebrarius (strain ATCC 17920 / DSM 40477 / JCM 4838 / CBS 697.72 / NBRC 16177 / NCIMB 11028 / NRRL B-12390 / A12253. 1 / ISP 5477) TaxID=1933 RepID=UPI0020A2F961|nr:suppressor of fused domain protein [Streptoalloteichus tenebrarius]
MSSREQERNAVSDNDDALVEHIERHLGRIRGDAPGGSVAGDHAYSLVIHDHPEYDMVSVVTNGLRLRRVDARYGEELVCSLQADQEPVARFLVDTLGAIVVDSGEGLEYGTVVQNDQPLVPGTLIQGVLATTHPFCDEEFNFYPAGTDEPQLQIITLVPITLAECGYAEHEGADALREIWAAQETDLLDVHRASTV